MGTFSSLFWVIHYTSLCWPLTAFITAIRQRLFYARLGIATAKRGRPSRATAPAAEPPGLLSSLYTTP